MVGRYNPSDLEDRYETRLRAMLDAKLAGAKLEDDRPPAPSPGNVIDLMAALKKSLGSAADADVGAGKESQESENANSRRGAATTGIQAAHRGKA